MRYAEAIRLKPELVLDDMIWGVPYNDVGKHARTVTTMQLPNFTGAEPGPSIVFLESPAWPNDHALAWAPQAAIRVSSMGIPLASV